jgi:FlaA1/EpsC-like NDP-sugar epimerase
VNVEAETASVREVWRAKILNWPRYHKRAVLVTIDLLLLLLALWVPISVRYGLFYVPTSQEQLTLLLLGPVITLAAMWRIGLYRLVTRFIGYRGTVKIFLGITIAVLVWSLLVFMSGQLGIPRSVILTYGLLGGAFLSSVRYAIGFLLDSVGIPIPVILDRSPPKPVLIYGAGQMGIALLQAVQRARDRKVIGFIDTSSTMWGQYVGGLKVHAPSKLERIVEREGIREVLVAIPGSHYRERRRILQELERYPVEVKILPAYEDVASGRVGFKNLRPVDVGDLLGREPVEPSAELLRRNTKGKAILMTGAGGSIGSELVRQILRQSPRLVVLLDVSEVALYEIDIEVRDALSLLPAGSPRPIVKAVLGSVLDQDLISDIIVDNDIETIYHAAAYKHVPLVEENPIAGLRNNVFGALVVAECARKHGVERVVLISTDKAVRPTNIMGASKRLAELVLQAEAAEPGSTVFTMVRFGNVLDSSGSVVRRFRKQIEAGGPVTVTDPEITRYFMSIPEAAELVIQAGAMAKGGEVFVLHMGERVRIEDLARLMIRLSGLEVRDEDNPEGDIEIVYSGLRPGEKLYEELLIGQRTSATEHLRIYKCDEPLLSGPALRTELKHLKAAMDGRDIDAIQTLLMRTVEGYKVNGANGGDVVAKDLERHPNWVAGGRTLH